MTNILEPSFLAPLIFSFFWIVFLISKDTITMLISLLVSSLILPVVYIEHYKLFWPGGLLLILISTGLIVIFAYIVRLHPQKIIIINKSWLGVCFTLLLLILTSFVRKVTHQQICSHYIIIVKVGLPVRFNLIFILLFLVVRFIRIVYRKGGGFRKKF